VGGIERAKWGFRVIMDHQKAIKPSAKGKKKNHFGPLQQTRRGCRRERGSGEESRVRSGEEDGGNRGREKKVSMESSDGGHVKIPKRPFKGGGATRKKSTTIYKTKTEPPWDLEISWKWAGVELHNHLAFVGPWIAKERDTANEERKKGRLKS